MQNKMRIGIVGYGNLGRGVEAALAKTNDMSLQGIFTRRKPDTVKTLYSHSKVFTMEQLDTLQDDIDVLLLCGGSKSDLPEQGPTLAAKFNIVDSFDTHARIPEYFTSVNAAAQSTQHVAIISAGWDPGLFSLHRLLGDAILPAGKSSTFWGRGVSQGHSDAIRRIPGVKAAVQYTVPSKEAMEKVRSGQVVDLTTREKHTRECYVVLEASANPDQIRKAIVEMPHYFSDYHTEVHFIDEMTLRKDHARMPHGGFVIHRGSTGTQQWGGEDHQHTMEFALHLGSNPEFTASVLIACGRAAHRLNQQQAYGAKTLFDFPLGLLSPKDPMTLYKDFL